MKIGYARISTHDQNLDLQEDALKAAGCGKIFMDRQSGATLDRPGLKDALDYVRAGDTLVVWRFDRLARSLKDLVQLIASLEERGVAFTSLTESIDTASPGGKLVFHIFGALAEFERNLIRERTKAGLNAARARGREGGRPPSLKPNDQELLKKLARDSMLTPKEIQKMFGISKATLYRYAKLNRTQNEKEE
ncbi:MAG: recombinase family protein [Alphaproteobacteria bacterium]|nr:recombinase family protein [Alphaproteobacteria bacterium]OJV44988.1 MAG: hypothetical protein BGO28_05475 [Alphaproteobacteria bacterium 43-37]